MSAKKHIGGRWSIKDGEIITSGANDENIDEVIGVIFRTEAWTTGDPIESEDQANARLIAAAPELLAALQSAVHFWDAYRIDDTQQIRAALDAARAAIAKATGV